MSTPKSKKEMLKKAKAMNPANWEGEWLEQVMPAIQEFVNGTVDSRVRKEFTKEERLKWQWGSDLEVRMDYRDIIVTEWLIPLNEEGKLVALDANGKPVAGSRMQRYFLRFDALQRLASEAARQKREVNIGMCYVPEVVILPGNPGWEAHLESIRRTALGVFNKARNAMATKITEINATYGIESDAGKYIGIRLAFNDEEKVFQIVTHKRDSLDVISNSEGEIDYIDLADIDMSIDNEADKGSFYCNCANLVQEHCKWGRIVKPSQAAYTQYSADLTDYLMSVTEEVYKRALEASTALGVKQTDVQFEYNLMNGGLEATYMGQVTDADGVESPEKKQVELVPMDRAAIVLVAQRIEPDMWFHVQAQYVRRFLGTYGKGDVTVSDEVLTHA